MSKKQFEKLVKEGIRVIPEKFLRLIDNVSVVIENWPTARQRKKLRLRKNETLFGLYEGIPKTVRDSGYNAVLPDKITIFKGSILKAAESEEEIKKLVKNTIWHEIAHHFGLSEKEAMEAEKKKRRQK